MHQPRTLAKPLSTRVMRTSILSAIALIGALAITGCSQWNLPPDLTSAKAESTTNNLVDDAVGQIDPAQIRRIEVVTNEEGGCGDGVSNPTMAIQDWTVQNDVWLVEGTDPVAVLNPIVDSYVAAGWTITIDRPATELGGRYVQMLDGEANFDTSFGLLLAAGIEDTAILVSSTSPCHDSTRE